MPALIPFSTRVHLVLIHLSYLTCALFLAGLLVYTSQMQTYQITIAIFSGFLLFMLMMLHLRHLRVNRHGARAFFMWMCGSFLIADFFVDAIWYLRGAYKFGIVDTLVVTSLLFSIIHVLFRLTRHR